MSKRFPNSDSEDIDNFKYTKKYVMHPNVEVGEYTYGLPRVIISPSSHLKIGKFCSIATEVLIFLVSNHRPDWVTTYPFAFLSTDYPNAAFQREEAQKIKGNIVIGNDVWIGQGVTIMPGVTIGDGAVIGAKSVVTKDITPFMIAAGNPCREKKKRFDDDIIEALLRIQWWDWPIDKIKENAHLLASDDIRGFVTKFS